MKTRFDRAVDRAEAVVQWLEDAAIDGDLPLGPVSLLALRVAAGFGAAGVLLAVLTGQSEWAALLIGVAGGVACTAVAVQARANVSAVREARRQEARTPAVWWPKRGVPCPGDGCPFCRATRGPSSLTAAFDEIRALPFDFLASSGKTRPSAVTPPRYRTFDDIGVAQALVGSSSSSCPPPSLPRPSPACSPDCDGRRPKPAPGDRWSP